MPDQAEEDRLLAERFAALNSAQRGYYERLQEEARRDGLGFDTVERTQLVTLIGAGGQTEQTMAAIEKAFEDAHGKRLAAHLTTFTPEQQAIFERQLDRSEDLWGKWTNRDQHVMAQAVARVPRDGDLRDVHRTFHKIEDRHAQKAPSQHSEIAVSASQKTEKRQAEFDAEQKHSTQSPQVQPDSQPQRTAAQPPNRYDQLRNIEPEASSGADRHIEKSESEKLVEERAAQRARLSKNWHDARDEVTQTNDPTRSRDRGSREP